MAVRLDDQEAIELARKVARDDLVPNAAAWELERQPPSELLRRVAGQGVSGALVPVPDGGSDLSRSAMALMFEELGSGCVPFAFALAVHANVTSLVAKAGSSGTRDHLADMLSGDRLAAFCYSEPSAGSDAAAIKTSAVLRGDKWVLNGEKAWVSNAAFADLFAIFAKTDLAGGVDGIGTWLVPRDSEGLEVTVDPLVGGNALGTGRLKLHDVAVPRGAVLFEPGKGYRAGLTTISTGRLQLAAQCCGALSACLAEALGYAAQRRAFGRSTLSFESVQFPLAEVATDLRAAQVLTREAASEGPKDQRRTDASHAKKFATRALAKGAAACMRAMGAAGTSSGSQVARHFTSAALAQFMDGTEEIQNIVIARQMIKDHGLEIPAWDESIGADR